jgi:NAD+ synthase
MKEWRRKVHFLAWVLGRFALIVFFHTFLSFHTLSEGSRHIMGFSREVLKIDADRQITHITTRIRDVVHGPLRRKGAVVGISGGIDSSACAALCVKALGPEHVVLLMLPDRDSSGASLELGRKLAQSLGVTAVEENITPILEGAGCYKRQHEAIRAIFPEYGDGWKCKVHLPSILESDRLNVSRLTVMSPRGETKDARLPYASYLQLVAATNFKQRTRTMMQYYHADRMNYAVCGTPNRLEYDQGFFVKGGDGLADVKPIAHLYKTQVFALARALGVPDEICNRTPTTDTFSLPQTQEEFYFALPYDRMDLCLYGHNHHIPASEVAPAIGMSAEQIERVYKDIETKRRSTLPLHITSLLVTHVMEIERLLGDLDMDQDRG